MTMDEMAVQIVNDNMIAAGALDEKPDPIESGYICPRCSAPTALVRVDDQSEDIMEVCSARCGYQTTE